MNFFSLVIVLGLFANQSGFAAEKQEGKYCGALQDYRNEPVLRDGFVSSYGLFTEDDQHPEPILLVLTASQKDLLSKKNQGDYLCAKGYFVHPDYVNRILKVTAVTAK